MGKKAKKAATKKKRPRSRKPKPSKFNLRWLGILSPTGQAAALISLIIGVVGFYYLLRPQIEVEPDTALDINSPMTTPFRITNRGNLPIYNVRKFCAVRGLETAQGNNGESTVSNLYFKNAIEPSIPKLESGESTSVSIEPTTQFIKFRSGPYVSGDIDVVVEFSTAILGIHEKKHYRFETRKSNDNEIRWYHKAASE